MKLLLLSLLLLLLSLLLESLLFATIKLIPNFPKVGKVFSATLTGKKAQRTFIRFI